MAKNHLRKIVVDGETYFWYRAHRHLIEYDRSPCCETLTVFLEDSKRNHLRILFKGDDNKHRISEVGLWNIGYPESGVLWLIDQDKPYAIDPMHPPREVAAEFNLNRPKVIATIIRQLRTTSWNPTEINKPLTIENGLHWLDENYKTLQSGIAPSTS